MNLQCKQIQELMHFELELGHNAAEATKNICCANGEGAVDQCSNQMVLEILLEL